MGLPPIHRCDHTPLVILSFDEAWDHDKIKEERAKLPKGAQHPWTAYHAYRARADLSTVRGYLLADPPSPPWVFELRRLTMREISIVENRELTNPPAALQLALSLGLVDVEGLELELERSDNAPHALTDKGLETLRGLVGDDGIRELAVHVVTASKMELTEPEKKP